MTHAPVHAGKKAKKTRFIFQWYFDTFVMLSCSVTLGQYSIYWQCKWPSVTTTWVICMPANLTSHVLVTDCAIKNQASFICLLLYISCSLAKAGTQISQTIWIPKVTFVIHYSWVPVGSLHGLSVCICLDWYSKETHTLRLIV